MKKLLSMLAALGMTATAASTVVSCTWGCSPAKADNVTLDKDGNVTATFDATLGATIDSKDDLASHFVVRDAQGHEHTVKTIEVVPSDTPTPLEAGKQYKFKITYNSDPYNGTEKTTHTVDQIDPKDQSVVKSNVASIDVPTNGIMSKDYANISSASLTTTKKSVSVSDGKGNYLGTLKNGTKHSVDANGHLVDSSNGKRIAGLDEKRNPRKDAHGKIIYIDNDGYRIDQDNNWNRVSNDGTTPLGPNTGDKAWEINDGKDVDSKLAPYKTKDSDGKTVYLDNEGYPVDPETGKRAADATKPADSETPYTGTKDGALANTQYGPDQQEKIVIKGNSTATLGTDIKDGGSIVIGDNADGKGTADGTAVALNPSASDATEWHTIKSGKYAGMQVRINPDNKDEVQYEWPATNKQIDDIISSASDSNSPVGKDGKISLPITYTDKDGKRVNDQSVSISTDLNNGSDESIDKYWIDSSFEAPKWKYEDVLSNPNGVDVNIYLSSSMVNRAISNSTWNWKTANERFNLPKVSIDNQLELNYVADKDGNYIQKSADGLYFLDLNVKVAQSNKFDFARASEDITVALSEPADKDGKTFSIFGDAQAVNEKGSSFNVTLNKISNNVTIDKTASETDKDNIATFKVDSIGSDIDTSNKQPVLLLDGTDISASGLLVDNKVDWNKDDNTFALKFKDGSLKKGNYALEAQFFIKDDKENKYGPINKTLTVTKKYASDEEKHVSFKENNISFNGYKATWEVASLGEFVDKTSAPKITIDYAKSNYMVSDEVSPENIKWDGNSLSFDLSGIPDINEDYKVNVTFGLGDFGDSQLADTLSVKADKAKSIKQDLSTASFKNTLSYQFSLATDNDSSFNYKAATVTINVQENKLNLTDDDFNYSTKDGVETVSLKNEIRNMGTDKLKFLVRATDGTNDINPQIVEIAKNEMNADSSAVIWKEKDNATTFDNTDLDHAVATFEIANKDTAVDVDFTKLKELQFVDDENTVKSVLNPNWDGEKLTLTLNDEIKYGSYKFRAVFDYTNGYEAENPNGTLNAPELTANKNVPLRKNTVVDVTQTAFSLDGGAEAVWQVNSVPPSIDLTDTKNIQVIMDDPTLASTLEPTQFIPDGDDPSKGLIKVKLDPKKEIPGGGQKVAVKIDFGTKDWNGYAGGQQVTGADGYVTKSEPTDGFFDIYWTKSDYQFSSDSSDAQSATFELDKTKTGVDVSTNNLTKIEWTDAVNPTEKDWKDMTSDKDSYSYENGKLAIKYTEDVMKTALLHTQPRQYRIHLGIGNGYENSKYAEGHKDGFESNQILKVEKTKSTSFERAVKVAGIVSEFDNDKNSKTWHVTADSADSINWSKSSMKVSWDKPADQVPWDSIAGITFKTPKNEEDPREIDPEKSHRKDPNIYSHLDIADAKDGGKDVTVSFDNGSLWQDNYKISLDFALKDYDGERSQDLTMLFSKEKPNDAEQLVSPTGGSAAKYEVTAHDWPTGLRTDWIGSYLEVKVTFDSFGGAVDPVLNPYIEIWGSGMIKGGPQGWGSKNLWYFMDRGQDGSKTWFKFKTWGHGNVASYYYGCEKGKYNAKLRLQFAIAGFGDSKNPTYGAQIVINDPKN